MRKRNSFRAFQFFLLSLIHFHNYFSLLKFYFFAQAPFFPRLINKGLNALYKNKHYFIRLNKKYKCEVIGDSIRLFDGKRVTYFEGDFMIVGKNKRLVSVKFYGRKRVSMTKYMCVDYSLSLNRRVRKNLIDILTNLAER